MTDEEIIEFLTENLYYFVTNDLVGVAGCLYKG